jgi:hypothetical protein
MLYKALFVVCKHNAEVLHASDLLLGYYNRVVSYAAQLLGTVESTILGYVVCQTQVWLQCSKLWSSLGKCVFDV